MHIKQPAQLATYGTAAKSQCGYNITDTRRGFHRGPRYRFVDNDKCDRSLSKLLWTGAEHQCPYYDDPPLCCPETTSYSGECFYGGTGRFCPGYDGARNKKLQPPYKWWQQWDRYDPGEEYSDTSDTDEESNPDEHGDNDNLWMTDDNGEDPDTIQNGDMYGPG
jgi:hypothetical protein